VPSGKAQSDDLGLLTPPEYDPDDRYYQACSATYRYD
jgi:hypothetical protein